MSKDPAFLFYPNDWIGGTMGMTFEEKGAYMELLMMQFNRGHMTKHMIAQTVGQIWVKIEDKFEVDKQGKYFNKRLEEEQKKRKEYTDSRRNNILGLNQYSKKGRKTEHMTPHMENENENENINKNENEIEVDIWPTFEDFWNAFDKKIGSKEKCEIKFNKLKQDIKEALMNHLFEYVKSTPNKKYRVNPETYLNQKRWENEIIENGKQKSTESSKRTQTFREYYPGYEKL